MSLVEFVASVNFGYDVAVVTQILIFPVFGLHTTLAQNLKMGAVFTVVSITRSLEGVRGDPGSFIHSKTCCEPRPCRSKAEAWHQQYCSLRSRIPVHGVGKWRIGLADVEQRHARGRIAPVPPGHVHPRGSTKACPALITTGSR